MTPTNKDIKVLGRVVSVAVDSIVVDASQVKDSTLNEFQDIINKRVQDTLNDFAHEIRVEGRNQGEETVIDDSGITTFNLSSTSGWFDTLTVDDSISAGHISVEENGLVEGNFEVVGDTTLNDTTVNGNLVVSEVGNGITIDNGDVTLILTADGIQGEDITLRGGITVGDTVSADTISASYAVNAELVNADQIKALYYTPKEVSGYNDIIAFLNDQTSFGRYYFEYTRSLDSDPCKYGVFIDVLEERDRDDNSLLKVYQTLTMACRNNPDPNLASYIYRTYNATTN